MSDVKPLSLEEREFLYRAALDNLAAGRLVDWETILRYEATWKALAKRYRAKLRRIEGRTSRES